MQLADTDRQKSWRLSAANAGYRLCATYPERLVVPAGISDDVIAEVGHPSVPFFSPAATMFCQAESLPLLSWPGGGIPQQGPLTHLVMVQQS